MTAPLRLGILGTARIARNFVAGLAGSELVVPAAIASRDARRAAQFAHETGVTSWFGSYDAMLESPQLDAVYNALPNALHAAWSIRAMECGKHVLCEKPLAGSHHDATAMFETAHRCGVRLVEAYPYRSQPQTLILQQLLADGVIGRLRTVHAAFGYPLADRTDIRFDPTLAGGALMDLGSYPLSFIRMLAGAAPASLSAHGVWDPAGVDRAAIVSLTFADDLLAQAACSFDSVIHRQALIAGDEGVIETTYANHTTDVPPVIRIRRGSDRRAPVESRAVQGMNGFRAEAEAFADFVHGGIWTGIPEHESLDVALMLDAARAQVAARAGVG
ncbi:MAG: Gfo/Idh/MocA family oxidoreductase [Gemmatimonadaceae bacterium]|nr:Gfo/Idh/MocA family oxidoreductase [Gemmatimonadaceae bacterium]